MRYQLGVEDMEPGHWIAWVFALPGCFASASSQDEAVADAPAEIGAYFAWLRAHEEPVPGARETIETEVVSVFHSFTSEDDYLVNAFFEADRSPLTPLDVARALDLLSYSRQDLLNLFEHSSPDRLAHPIPGEVFDSITGILMHIAQAERWYFHNIGLEQAPLPGDPLAALDLVRAQTRAWLPELIGDQRIHEWKQEQWSARKVLRRTLWHERDHTKHIRKLLSQIGA